ncbi:hypothetical protein KA405_02305 [Patescibacteria group bacterium]|nr:hypothetical protein [Patescibacteria group bacterium]
MISAISLSSTAKVHHCKIAFSSDSRRFFQATSFSLKSVKLLIVHQFFDTINESSRIEASSCAFFTHSFSQIMPTSSALAKTPISLISFLSFCGSRVDGAHTLIIAQIN